MSNHDDIQKFGEFLGIPRDRNQTLIASRDPHRHYPDVTRHQEIGLAGKLPGISADTPMIEVIYQSGEVIDVLPPVPHINRQGFQPVEGLVVGGRSVYSHAPYVALDTEDHQPPVAVRPALTEDYAARKGLPLATGLLDYFPDALAEVARLSKYGNDKHNPGQPLHWARGKSDDHADCILRHMIDRGKVDASGFLHDVMVAWRALAQLQLALEKLKT